MPAQEIDKYDNWKKFKPLYSASKYKHVEGDELSGSLQGKMLSCGKDISYMRHIIIRTVIEEKHTFELWDKLEYIEYRELLNKKRNRDKYADGVSTFDYIEPTIEHHEFSPGDAPNKLHMDCEYNDGDWDQDEILEAIKATLIPIMIAAMKETFVNSPDIYEDDVVVMEREGYSKPSYHLIIPAVCENTDHLKAWAEAVLKKITCPKMAKLIDMKLFKWGHSLSTLWSTKKGCRIDYVSRSHYAFEDSLFSNIGEQPPMKLAPNIIIKERGAVSSANYTGDDKIIMGIIARNVPSFAAFDPTPIKYCNKFTFRRLKNISAHCRICDRTHDGENSLYVTISSGGGVYEKCRCDSSKSIRIGSVATEKTVAAREAKKVVVAKKSIIERLGAPMKCDETRPADVAFFQEIKVGGALGVRASMGMGKTKALIIYRNSLGPTARVLTLSMRKSFTTSMQKNFPNARSYLDVLAEKGVHHISNKVTDLIIQLDSLVRLTWQPCSIDLLIVDEIESIHEQLFDNTMSKDRAAETFRIYMALLQFSKRVIIMDANLDCKYTIDIIQKLRKSPIDLKIYEPRPQKKTIGFTVCDLQWKNKLESLLKAGKNVFVPCNQGPKWIEELEQWLRVRFPALDKLVIHAEIESKTKVEIFSDVHKHWRHQLVITSPTCGPGISFTDRWFDACMPAFINCTTSVNYARQMMQRVRGIENVYILFMKGQLSTDPATYGGWIRRLSNRFRVLIGDEPRLNITEYDHMGWRVIGATDYNKMWIRHRVNKARDNRDFMDTLLLAERVANPGACFIDMDTVDNLPAIAILTHEVEMKEIRRDVKERRANDIVAAESLLPQQAAAIFDMKTDDHSVETTRALAKAQLAKSVGVQASDITTTRVVDILRKPEIRKAYEWRKLMTDYKDAAIADLQTGEKTRIYKEMVANNGSAFNAIDDSRVIDYIFIRRLMEQVNMPKENDIHSVTFLDIALLKMFETPATVETWNKIAGKEHKQIKQSFHSRIRMLNTILSETIGYQYKPTSSKCAKYKFVDIYPDLNNLVLIPAYSRKVEADDRLTEQLDAMADYY